MQPTNSRWRPPVAPNVATILRLPVGEARSLSPLQRILLSTDGTVTHVLEAYAGEPIEVVKLLQVFEDTTAPDGDLGLAGGERVLRRRVVLRGRQSWRNVLYAEAIVVADRVDGNLLDDLLSTDKPIGALLAQHRTETFREILGLGWEPAGACGRHFGLDDAAEVIFRTYRVIAQRLPVLLITEKFPPTFFRSLPH